MSGLTVVILTKDEELHIERALASVEGIAERCFVIDSGSDDQTVELAKSKGAIVLHNPWVNHAAQFNWALDQLPKDTGWVLRLDADEIVTEPLRQEIMDNLDKISPKINGIYVSRRINFLGSRVRFGGLFPIRIIRLFRHGSGRCEDRWMDEHILVEGETADFKGEIVDDNRNFLNWWIDKHNSYASREVINLLNLKYHFMASDTIADLSSGRQASVKRWIKERFYARMPNGSRALFYFLYRYIICLGFLDSREGRAFHVLQGFWYRYLVDMKLAEVNSYMRHNRVDAVTAIKDVLGIYIKENT